MAFAATYIAALFSIVAFALGGLILYEKRGSRLSFFLASVMLAAGLWAFSNAEADVALSSGSALFWSGLAVTGFLYMTSFMLMFVDSFMHGGDRVPWKRIVPYFTPTVLLTYFDFTRWVIAGATILYTEPSLATPGPLYVPGTLFVIFSFIYAYWMLTRRIRYVEPAVRNQILYIEAGLFLTLAGCLVFDIILPLFGQDRFYSIGPVATIFMISAIGYAIFYHRLLNIRVIVQRSLVYTVMLALVIGFYLALVETIGLMVYTERDNDGIPILIAAGITTVLGIFTVPLIERYFRKVTDRYFFRDQYDRGRALEELAEMLTQNLSLGTIVESISRKLAQVLKVHHVRFALTAGGFPMAMAMPHEAGMDRPRPIWGAFEEDVSTQHRSEMVPIVLDDRRLGTIEVGGKLSGEPLSEEDIRFLKTFSSHTAVALEKARLYDEVKRYSEELEHRVEERTAEIKIAQEDQKQMMVDISHNLQTPLTIIKLQLALLKKHIDEEHYVMFERSIDEISKFIYDMLNLARLEMRRDDELPKEAVDLSDLVCDIVEYFSPLADEKSIRMIEHVEPGIKVHGNADQIREVIANVISNAFKYVAPDRQNIVKVSLFSAVGRAALVISDTGIGIHPDDLGNIFKRFYRSQKSASSIRGSGLGLAISKKIVESHAGLIDVTSSLGKGTTFTIILPKLGNGQA